MMGKLKNLGGNHWVQSEWYKLGCSYICMYLLSLVLCIFVSYSEEEASTPIGLLNVTHTCDMLSCFTVTILAFVHLFNFFVCGSIHLLKWLKTGSRMSSGGKQLELERIILNAQTTHPT